MHVYAIQPDIVWEDPARSIAHVRDLLSGMTIEPGSLLVLPEMFSTGFSMNVSRVAEGSAKPAESFLREIAMTYQSIALGGVVNIAATRRGLNQALGFDATGQEIIRYNKVHPFSYSQETDHYDAGQKVLNFSHAGWNISPLVCYDLRFPELFRIAAGNGAQLLVVIANWPASRIDHWTTLLKARAIENQSYVIGVNRVGHDPVAAYNGQSVILDPKGHALAQGSNQPLVLHATLDLESLLAYRAKFPALADMKYHWDADSFSR